MHENFGSPRVAVIASGEGKKILGSWLVCELTFFMDTDSTGTPETAIYPRYAAYIVLSSRGVRTEKGEDLKGRGNASHTRVSVCKV